MMNLPKNELEKFSQKDKVVKEYMDKLNRINEDPAFLNLIDYEEDNIRIMNSLKKEAEEKGFREGQKKGIEQGIEQGVEQGILQVARKLLETERNIEEVSKITGLSIEKLESLKEQKGE